MAVGLFTPSSVPTPGVAIGTEGVPGREPNRRAAGGLPYAAVDSWSP